MKIALSSIAGTFACTAISLVASTNASADIIDATYGAGAGSFELGTFVNNACGVCIDYMRQSPGSTTIVGWTVGGPGDGVDWLVSPTFQAASGIHAVDLTNSTLSSITTVIPTTVGVSYALTFQSAGITSPGTFTTGAVSAGSLLTTFSVPTSASTASQSFTSFSYVFVASSASTTVRFAGISGAQFYGPVIDAVSVTAVPEPTSLTLLVSGSVLLSAFKFAGSNRRMRSAVQRKA